MIFTEHYNLNKPGDEDFYNIAHWNENMDTLDEALAEQENSIGEMNEKMGTPAVAGNTLFSLLENNSSGNGMSAVKSIQHVFYTIPAESSGGSVSIRTVDPAKSFVLFELLCEQVSYVKNVSYTLNAANITVSHSYVGNGMDVGAIVYGFWVIELC